MKNNISLNLYKISAAILTVLSLISPLAVSADVGDSGDYSYSPSSNYSDSYSYTPSSNYSDSYSYTPSSNYSDSYSYSPSSNYSDYSYTPSSNYSDSYSYTPSSNYTDYSYTPSYDYYTTNTTSGSNYSYSYSNPYSYNRSYSYGYTTTPSYSYSKVSTNNSTKTVAQTYSVSGSCAGYPSTATIGQSVTWSANGSGGNGSYSYVWSGDVSGSSQSVSTSYSSSGTKNATVYISSNGVSVTRTCSIYVKPATDSSLSLSCYANPSSTQTGNTVTWYSSVSGGTGSYSYSWSGATSGSSQSVSNTYSSSGTQTAYLTVTSGSQSATANCSTYVYSNYYYNNGSPSASCYSNNSNPSVGQSIVLSATASGGNGSYSYLWGGDAYSGTSQSINQTFYSSGTKYITVQVYSNGQYTTANCSVNVGGSSNITVYGNNAGSGGLTSGVFLSQIPYTGLSGGWNVSLFILGLFFWSAIIAWFILRKKEMNGKFSRSEMIAKFKQQNLAQKLTSN